MRRWYQRAAMPAPWRGIAGVAACSMWQWLARRLEPHPHAGDDARVVDVLALLAAQVRGATVGALADQSEVRREPTGDLVAQPQPEFHGAQSLRVAVRRVVF